MNIDSDLISIAKRTIASGTSPVPKQFYLKRLDDLATEPRQPNQTFYQSYSKLLESDEGRMIFQASKIAPHVEHRDREVITKAMNDGIHQTASQRLAKCVVDLMESAPQLSQAEATEQVIRKNELLYGADGSGTPDH
jgi:hypothetical protein